jgi:hypothetical protein
MGDAGAEHTFGNIQLGTRGGAVSRQSRELEAMKI